MTKLLIAVALSVAALEPVLAQDYFLVVPVKGRTKPAVPDISVTLQASPLPSGNVGQLYRTDLTLHLQVLGDPMLDLTQATWLSATALPPGLILQSNGVIVGTPTLGDESGTSFEVTASYKKKSASQRYSISVAADKTIASYSGYKAWADGSFAHSCNEYRNPGANHQYSGSTGDGVYRIQPVGSTLTDVFCDMTTEGGGWTRLGSNVATFSRPLNAAQSVVASYSPNGECSANGQTQFSVTKVVVPATRVRMDFTRSTVSQCSGLANGANSAALKNPAQQYWNGNSYVALPQTCAWSASNWSKSSGDSDISGLPTRFRFFADLAADKGVTFKGNCSIPTDNGQYSATMFVK